MASPAAELRTKERGARQQSEANRAEAEPLRRQKEQPAAELGVVDRRNLLARRERRQVTVLVLAAALFVAGALAIVAGGRALVARDQVTSDSLQGAIASALGTEQNLRLERANLEAPGRILHIATTQLHMVTPTSVVYLEPINPGETVAEAHGASVGAASSRRSASSTGLHEQRGSSPGHTRQRRSRAQKS